MSELLEDWRKEFKTLYEDLDEASRKLINLQNQREENSKILRNFQ